jgi:C1A family cysteine protease
LSKPKLVKRSHGWVPDSPDHRDFHYSEIRKAPRELPPKVDLRLLPPVVDQDGLSSCSACALAGMLEFIELKDGLPLAPLSRLFVYYGERVIENSVRSDSGAMLRDGMKTLAKQGVCAEKTWPYVVSKFRTKPNSAAYAEALTHRIRSYHRLLTTEEMRACLSEGYPFAFGFWIFQSFESKEVEKTGVVPMPSPGEKHVDGHAAMAIGYDDSQRRFTAMSSYGKSWGKKGFFTIPYEYLEHPKLANDFWTIRHAEHI